MYHLQKKLILAFLLGFIPVIVLPSQNEMVDSIENDTPMNDSDFLKQVEKLSQLYAHDNKITKNLILDRYTKIKWLCSFKHTFQNEESSSKFIDLMTPVFKIEIKAYEYQKKIKLDNFLNINDVACSVFLYKKLLDLPIDDLMTWRIHNFDFDSKSLTSSIIDKYNSPKIYINKEHTYSDEESQYLEKLLDIYQKISNNGYSVEHKKNPCSNVIELRDLFYHLEQLIHKEAVENDRLHNLREQKETLKNQVIQTAQEVISQFKKTEKFIKNHTDPEIEKVAQSIATYQQWAGLGTNYFVKPPKIIKKYNEYKVNVDVVKSILQEYDKDSDIQNLYFTYYIVGIVDSNKIFSNKQKILQLSRSVIEGQAQKKKILEELLKEKQKAQLQALTTAAVVTGVLATTAAVVYYTQPKK